MHVFQPPRGRYLRVWRQTTSRCINPNHIREGKGIYAGVDTGFSEGGGMATRGGGWSGVIAPVGEKLLFEHTQFSATRGGGGWSPPPCIRHWHGRERVSILPPLGCKSRPHVKIGFFAYVYVYPVHLQQECQNKMTRYQLILVLYKN